VLENDLDVVLLAGFQAHFWLNRNAVSIYEKEIKKNKFIISRPIFSHFAPKSS